MDIFMDFPTVLEQISQRISEKIFHWISVGAKKSSYWAAIFVVTCEEQPYFCHNHMGDIHLHIYQSHSFSSD